MIFGLTACSIPGGGTAVCQHRDVNDDGACDKCSASYTDGKDLVDQCSHRDKDDDNLCDRCDAAYTDGKDVFAACQHRDADDDGRCDKCYEAYTDGKDIPDAPACQHRDADDNGECDKCEEAYTDGKDIPDAPVCQHRDADDNGECDKCEEAYTDGKDIPDGHVHNYNVALAEEKFLCTPADTQNAATYYYSCLCGDKGTETFSYGEPLPISYSVTFNFDNGSASITANYAEGARLTAIEPLKNGYTFVEWQCNGVTWDFAKDVVTSDMVLTAIWQKNAATLGALNYNSAKTAISVNDEITPALFGATCYYSDGTAAKIDVTVSGTVAAGNLINVRLSVTDENETKQITIKNIKVYGAPALTYDESITWVNIHSGLNKDTFSAVATDTFGGAATVNVAIEGTAKAGTLATVVITATDAVGNQTVAKLTGIKAYASPTIVYNTSKSYIKVSDTLNADLFAANATDSFGKACEIEITCAKIKAGTTVTLTITATDEVGNQATKSVSGIKVYGTPRVVIESFLYDTTDISFIATVYDSFGVELTPDISYVGEQTDGNEVIVTVKATDSVGNTVEKEYSYIVNHGEHNWAGGYCEICNSEFVYRREGDYIYFGEYPQTLKADDVTITETQDSRGYYLGSDGFYYAKVTAYPYNSGYTFSTGATVSSGSVYYFKVEPIRWRILSTDGETALILCDSIIANKAYDEYNNGNYSNNYKNSDIRAWLNEQFYETAFSDLQKQLILTTTVDNSAKSTNPYGQENYWNNGVNPYACEDTEDKIFLLSYREVTNSAYGFATSRGTYDIARRMLTSDYARATGAYTYVGGSYDGHGYWWLRSPGYYSDNARSVGSDGNADGNGFVSISGGGVVPALQIWL